MKRHYNLVITGKVQGVGYRFSCVEAARKCGVKGFVRNNSNGSVYAEAEGAEEELAAFISWCRRGPAWARVTDVQIIEGELQHFDSFVINR
jgi:acylphosphatase